MNRFNMGPLFAPLGTAGGGGGAGDAAPLTMEVVTAEIDRRVGATISTHFEKFKTEGLGKAIDEKLAPISSSLTGITEAISKLTINPSPNPNPNTQSSQVPPELNVTLKNLQETTKSQGTMIETLKKEKLEADQRAERSDRHSVIRTALGNLHFINEPAAQTAFMIVEPHIKRMEDNSLIGAIPNGDNFPVDAFIKDFLTKEHSYLLRPSGASGSGAPGGNNTGIRMGLKADLSDIKVGMKPETRESIVASIGAALQNQ